MRTTIVLLAAATLLGTTGAAAALKHQSSAAHFRASVVSVQHSPFVGHRWRFSIHAMNAGGHPIAASALVRVLVDGHRLDTIGQFGFKGNLGRSYRWSQNLRGLKAVIQAKVTGPGGTRTVRLPVRVRSYSGKPEFRVRLRAGTRRPVAGAIWTFALRARNAAGRGISGTARVRVLLHGRPVDTVGWFGIKRSISKTYTWSPKLRGQRAVLQVSVVGPGGTRTVTYAVRVR